jgi:hypothetical protein
MDDGRDSIDSIEGNEYLEAASMMRQESYQLAEAQWSNGSQANGADPNVNGGNGRQPWRAGYGNVAPGARAAGRADYGTLPGRTDSGGWRSGYNRVAPGFVAERPGVPGAGGRNDSGWVATGAPGEFVPPWRAKPDNIPARPKARIFPASFNPRNRRGGY